MIERVMLDLDDVCNEFTMAALKYVGATDTKRPYTDYPIDCGWDIVNAANKLAGESKYTPNIFWEGLDRNFWATIPPVPYLDQMISFLADLVGRDNICIATSATIAPDCLAGKMEWIYKYMPRWLHRQYMIGTQKHLLAGPNTLLIDDRIKNCESFREAGGAALMVWKPWNYGGFIEPDTVASLNIGLFTYFGRMSYL